MARLTPEERRAFDEAFPDEIAGSRGLTQEQLERVFEGLASVKDPDVLDRILAVARQRDFSPEKQARLLSACRKMLTGLTSH